MDMDSRTIAAVQMDCQRGDKAANLASMCERLGEAAGRGARLVVFPECILTGYCFNAREEAHGLAETLPGPSSQALAEECQRLGAWMVYGLLERDPKSDRFFNACALIGPEGFVASYRKIHLPCLGV